MTRDNEQALQPGAAPLEEVKRSVHSDLQYVSLEVEGKTYGGWYRVLSNGHMELLALANMRSTLRSEGAPVEQARAMLFDFIRTAQTSSTAPPAGQQVGSSASVAAADSWQRASSGTLGDLLYADGSRKHASEEDWVRLVEATAARDKRAFRDLYERTHRLVYTLIVQIAGDRKAAEDLTLEVYLDIWRAAPAYRPARASVLAWIMNQARFRALATRAEQRDASRQPDAPRRRMECALQALTAEERRVIETALSFRMPYLDMATELRRPGDAVAASIRSALGKLRGALDPSVAPS